MRVKTFVLAAAAALAMTGCGSDSTGPSSGGGSGDWLPLAVGNQWVYSLNGTWRSATDQDTVWTTGTFTVELTGETTHEQGFSLFVVRDVSTTTMNNGDTSFTYTDTTFSYTRNDGSEVQTYDDLVSTDYTTILRLPLTVGESWNPDPDEPTTVREVMSLSESVSVPSGSFSGCARIRDTDTQFPDNYIDFYFARGVGSVYEQAVIQDEFGTGEYIVQLTSYSVN